MRTAAYYHEEYVVKQRSVRDIAAEHQTYPNKITRELRKLGFKLRTKSEAQSVAIKTGRHKHPTKGVQRDADTRLRISESMIKIWEGMTPAEKRRRVDKCKEAWNATPPSQQKQFRDLAAKSVRRASEGSKLEHFLLDEIEKRGYKVEFHDPEAGVDFYIPTLGIVIDVHGPTHFLPIWGQESLERIQEADETKIKQHLDVYGNVFIRVKTLGKSVTEVGKLDLLKQILNVLEQRPTKAALVEIEVR